MSKTITHHLSIRGRVQGVGFRNYMTYKAEQLGISGWVRNRNDGSVEATVQGQETAVAAMNVRSAGRVHHRSVALRSVALRSVTLREKRTSVVVLRPGGPHKNTFKFNNL